MSANNKNMGKQGKHANSKQVTKVQDKPSAETIKVFSQLLTRANLASRLGQQYSGDRDLYEQLGYQTSISYDDYATRYSRQDIASTIIDRPVNYTWKGGMSLNAVNEENDGLLDEFKVLDEKIKVQSKLKRLDKLSELGSYAVLLLGFSDVQSSQDLSTPVTGTKLDLNYIKPFGEGNAEISVWEKDASNERYGLPKYYQLKMYQPGGDNYTGVLVHYSRVLHVAGELLENEVEGKPALQVVYNRLMDLEKLVGSSAEMFWRGARPGIKGDVKEDYELTETQIEKMATEFKEFEHDLRRVLVNEGVTYDTFKQQLADPINFVEVQLQMISAATGIPKRILVGSERGELASTEDRNTWLEIIQTRREERTEPTIVRPFVDVCMKYGILTSEKEYTVEWEDLFSPSQKEKAEVGKIRASALKEYAVNPAIQDAMPPAAFFKYFLGLDADQIDDIETMVVEQFGENGAQSDQLTEEERELIQQNIKKYKKESTK